MGTYCDYVQARGVGGSTIWHRSRFSLHSHVLYDVCEQINTFIGKYSVIRSF